ncbi:hypothetical protein ACUODJ_53335, partial [Escherichia sp. HC-CC]
MDKFDANRRKLLALGGVALGAAILPTPAFATLSTPRPRILAEYLCVPELEVRSTAGL